MYFLHFSGENYFDTPQLASFCFKTSPTCSTDYNQDVHVFVGWSQGSGLDRRISIDHYASRSYYSCCQWKFRSRRAEQSLGDQ